MKHRKKILFTLIAFLLISIVAIRLLQAVQTAACFDGYCYTKTAAAVLKGISPYHEDIWTSLETCPPTQSPGMTILAMPICHFSRFTQKLIFLFCGILFYYAFVILVFHYYGYRPKDYLKLQWESVPVWIVLTMLGISSPFMLMLAAGQNSSIAALLLFAVLFYPQNDKQNNIYLLALAAAVKYSLLTLLAPLLLLQKRIKVAIVSFVIFLIIILSVGLWLNGILPALFEYIALVIEQASNGCNSYSNGGDVTLLSLGFFTAAWLNTLLKIVVLGIYILALIKLHMQYTKQKDCKICIPLRLVSPYWGLFTVMTCMISYHRLHDGILFLPFLGVVFLDKFFSWSRNFSTGKHIQTFLSFTMLLFWACPRKYVFKFSASLAQYLPGGANYLFYAPIPHSEPIAVAFPVMQCVMLIMLFLFAWTIWEPDEKNGNLNPC